MLQQVCRTIVYSKISLPTIEAANVEVRAVCESQDTPAKSLYHMRFVMLEQLPKKGGADFNYNARVHIDIKIFTLRSYIDNKAVVCE